MTENPHTNAKTDSLSRPVVKLLFCIFCNRVIYFKCSLRQLYKFFTLKHQQYLNKAKNDGFFYKHRVQHSSPLPFMFVDENKLHTPSIQTEREVWKYEQDREWRNTHWPQRYWWSCLLNGLTFLSWWWKSSYFLQCLLWLHSNSSFIKVCLEKCVVRYHLWVTSKCRGSCQW